MENFQRAFLSYNECLRLLRLGREDSVRVCLEDVAHVCQVEDVKGEDGTAAVSRRLEVKWRWRWW